MAIATSVGRITKVAGPVVDVEFPPNDLPEILFALEINFEAGGESRRRCGPRPPSISAAAGYGQ